MANISGDKVSLRQPATPLRKPFLVAYSDSDSESSSSDTPDPAINFKAEAKQLDAAEALMALCMTKITSPDESTARGTQKLLGTTTTNNDNTIAEGSHQADHHDTKLDDDEAIPEVNDDTHEIEYEPTVSDCNDEAEDSTTMPRCWGDIKYPRIGTCDHEFNIANEGERYRKVVSDFFGRNKKATASVPPDCYPTICRTCYQRLAYRLGSMNKDDPEKDAAAVAKLRCDAIIAALEKMKEKKFVDRNGHVWPWWCGLELQLTNDGRALLDNPEKLEAEIEKKNGEIAKQKAEKATSPKGKLFKRLHKRVKPGPLPDWLQKLCRTNTGNGVSNDVATSTVGDRNGVRYSFDELILIIKAIKTFCHESRCAFPTVEAIPVPIGLLDEQILKDKKKLRTSANKMKNQTRKAAADAEREARDWPSNFMRKKKAAARRKAANDATAEAEAAEKAVDYAQEDALLSAGTIPGKRLRSDTTLGKIGKACKVRINLKKMKAEKVLESPPKTIKDDADDNNFIPGDSGASEDGDIEEDISTKSPPKRARISKPKTKPRLKYKSYQDWKKRKYGSNPPPPPATAAEARARMRQARRDGYALKVADLSSESEDE